MAKIVKPGTEWPDLVARMRGLVPEAFGADGQVLNLTEGEWGQPGHGRPFTTSVDGSTLGRYPMLNLDAARRAVRFAAGEAAAWARVDLDERRRRVTECVNALREQRELIALLLMWEIGKPWQLALNDVDRCNSGVEWYVDNIEGMLDGRRPLGLVSNIASWNYPLSVLVHAMLVQVLAGNPVIAKTPTDGGLYALTLSAALARRCGLPVSLVSGSGGQISDALVRDGAVSCLSFVGGKASGRDIAMGLLDTDRRYMLEMEGVNAYGIWEFSDWDNLAAQIRKGYEYGKQRCTAYVRFVVQRRLFARFLEAYLPVVRDLKFGHPFLVDRPEDELPKLDFGPLINHYKSEELAGMVGEALGGGAVPLYEGAFDPSRFLPNQDVSAYSAPVSLLNPPHKARLYFNEPFGPVDTIIVVDRMEELIGEMNVSNGCLVASVACDDPATAKRIGSELRSFKVGINQLRSRGDREEVFGGIGQSWKGAFVGGSHLVRAVTQREAGERLPGNFPDYTLIPEGAR